MENCFGCVTRLPGNAFNRNSRISKETGQIGTTQRSWEKINISSQRRRIPLWKFKSPKSQKERLHFRPDFLDRIYAATDRTSACSRNLQPFLATGRLNGTGYLSILPVDQGIDTPAAASFANPDYSTAEHREAGHRRRLQRRRFTFACSARSRESTRTKFVIVKMNHN